MIYNFVLLLYLFFLTPLFLIERLKGKRHPAFFQRLGFFLPKNIRQGGVWVHAVSVGEVKAAKAFLEHLKGKWICVTTTTATGYAQAKKMLTQADDILYLPLDFSFVIRRFVKKLKPSMFVLIEGDFWPNLLKELRDIGCKTFLVSGKLSQRSFTRWQKVPFFAKKLFSSFDLLCVQDEEIAKRFFPFVGDKVRVTGNLKFDMKPETPEHVFNKKTALTLSSTHVLEEELLLDKLAGAYPLFLVPRHPERFNEVERLLIKKNISFARFSKVGWSIDKQVLLVDAMGKLATCYANSLLAIIGGSFVPGIGGHNVLEPCLYQCPVIFGLYAFSQKPLVKKVLDQKVGIQSSYEGIVGAVNHILEHQEDYCQKASLLAKNLGGASNKTWEEISREI